MEEFGRGDGAKVVEAEGGITGPVLYVVSVAYVVERTIRNVVCA